MKQEELDRVLKQHKLWSQNAAEGVHANLRGAILQYADLTGADLSDANLFGAILRAANLTGADLRAANLQYAILPDAILRGAILTGANLRGADLTAANLYSANLQYADLRGANLQGADLTGANITRANAPQLIAAGPAGSRHDQTILHAPDQMVFCGCFRGTLTEFAAQNEETHSGNPVHLAEYRAMVEFFKAVMAARGKSA